MRIFARHFHRWKDNTEIHLKDIECENVVGIRAVRFRDQWRALMYAVMTLESYKMGEFL
jgi:hypothetical protein